MPRRYLILGTAGHIDHGKTSLVKALTGTDTDRLPEEKARGITIDIGFAELAFDDLTLGVVDVPGHERFVHNMLAGATGVDLGLLVVAADDGIMPQTREHLEILQFLGVKAGVIAITKCDLVDDTTRGVLELELRDLVKTTFLDGAAIIPTAAPAGIGVPQLKAALLAAANSIATPARTAFRLPIDRVFVRQGHGTIITGSVLSGRVTVGESLDWHQDGGVESVRIRSLANHGREVSELDAGMRGAINLAGVPHERVHRGQELATPGSLKPSRVVSVSFTVSRSISKPLRHRLPVRFHAGTAEVMGEISLLEASEHEPHQPLLAQLCLDGSVTVTHGQTFVLRDSSAERTLGGGRILDPLARKLRRRDAAAIEQLHHLASDDAKARAIAAATVHDGVATRDFPLLASVTASDVERLVHSGALIRVDDLLQSRERWITLKEQILARLTAFHTKDPAALTHDRARLVAGIDPKLAERLVDELMTSGAIVGDRTTVSLAKFQTKLTATQVKWKERIVREITAAGVAPPEVKSFITVVGGSAKTLNDILDVAIAEQSLVRVSNELCYGARLLAEMQAKLTTLLAGNGKTVAEIRDGLGTTRKYAVPLCEYWDRVGVTRREGDLRFLA